MSESEKPGGKPLQISSAPPHRQATEYPEKPPGRWADVVDGDGEDVQLCENWLTEVCAKLGSYEGKLLRRHVPSLSQGTLERLVATTALERAAFLAQIATRGQTGNALSKMQMRLVLQGAMEKLASSDDDVGELLHHWKATAEKSSRKGKTSSSQHYQNWKDRQQNRSQMPYQ
jgi:hypothetical protein